MTKSTSGRVLRLSVIDMENSINSQLSIYLFDIRVILKINIILSKDEYFMLEIDSIPSS